MFADDAAAWFPAASLPPGAEAEGSIELAVPLPRGGASVSEALQAVASIRIDRPKGARLKIREIGNAGAASSLMKVHGTFITYAPLVSS
jgi:hypothetical protein